MKKWRLSDFEIGRRLGKEKFVDMYIAREKESNIVVALKTTSKSHLIRIGLQKQLKVKLEIHDKLNHRRLFSF